MAKQDNATAKTQEMPAVESPRAEEQERRLEAVEGPEIGATSETTRADGSTVVETNIGRVEINGENKQVIARTDGEIARFKALSPQDQKAERLARTRLALFGPAVKSVAESSVKAAGLKGDVAKSIVSGVVERQPEILARAAGQEDTEKAMETAVMNEIQAQMRGEQIERMSLKQLYARQQDIRKRLGDIQADPSITNPDKQIAKLFEESEAIGDAIVQRRAELHPDMTAEEHMALEDETRGFITPDADPLFAEGSEAMLERLAQLHKDMLDAQQAGNLSAEIKAQDKIMQLETALPVVLASETAREIEVRITTLETSKSPTAKAKLKELKTQFDEKTAEGEVIDQILGVDDILDVITTTPPPFTKETAADRAVHDLRLDEEELGYADFVEEEASDLENMQVLYDQLLAAGMNPEVEDVPESFEGIARMKPKAQEKMYQKLLDLNYQYTSTGSSAQPRVAGTKKGATPSSNLAHAFEFSDQELGSPERRSRYNQLVEAMRDLGQKPFEMGVPETFESIKKLDTNSQEALFEELDQLYNTYVARGAKYTEAGVSRATGKRVDQMQPGTGESVIDYGDQEKQFNALEQRLKTEHKLELADVGLPGSFEYIRNLPIAEREQEIEKMNDAIYEYGDGYGLKKSEAGIASGSGLQERREPAKFNFESEDIIDPEMLLTPEVKSEYPDLVKAGILADGLDLRAWEKSYNEVKQQIADELEMSTDKEATLKSKGLPETFQEILNMKDERGWWSRNVFNRNKPTKRAQMFNKIAELHMAHVVGNPADMTDRSARQKTSAKEQARVTARTGGGTKTGGRAE